MARINDPWPEELPQYLFQGNYTETPPDVVLRTQMDTGPIKQRSKASSGSTPVTGSMKLTIQEVKIFDEFFQTNLVNGTLSFDWLHPRTRVPVIMRFTDVPTYSAQTGVFFTVSMPLEILRAR